MTDKVKPIKRNPALVEFSKDHHFGLLLVWKIRQGLKMNINPERICEYVINFFETDLLYHFADEEKYLFTELAWNDVHRFRVEQEHANIRYLVDEIKHTPDSISSLKDFADLLEVHIRFEERELFNRLQASMSESDLLQLLNDVPARPHTDDNDWEDHFWVFKKENKVA